LYEKLFLIIPFFLFAEVDPFNAGLNSNSPYGLTPQEKAILQNKKSIQNLQQKISKLSKNFSSFKIKLISYEQTISDLKEKISAF
jgi:septal ring factor EnvC (AmiA/AmiB activator)